MGKRVEENKAEINDIENVMKKLASGELPQFIKEHAMNASFLAMLADISKSLAIIADKL